jgi:protein-S-isoprenylcysteine O-methyltransferase Ste14
VSARLARLARLRVPLGFFFGAIVVWLARPTPTFLAWGAAIAIAGEALRVWASGHLEKGREVTSSGPYRFMRHPLYVGSTLMGVGLAVASRSVAVAILVGIYLVTLITAAIRTEEAFLRSRFGGAYDRYASGEVAARRFSLARAVANREYRAVAGLTGALGFLAWRSYGG